MAPLSNSKVHRKASHTTVFAAAGLALVLCSLPNPALALTAGDVADKMTGEQQVSWVTGAIDMAAHLYRRMGDEQRATCLAKWGGSVESVREIDEAMRTNRTLQAAAVIDVLIARHCAPKP